MSELAHMGWQTVKVTSRFTSPTLQQNLHGGVDGVVRENGEIECEAVEDDLRLKDKDAIPPGTDVTVSIKNTVVCRPKAVGKHRKKERLADKRAKAWERQKEREQQERERQAFWNQYDIPIDFATGQNNRISELRRGSTGTGTTSSTVTHFVVLEPFQEGRLQREAQRFLCKNEGKYSDTSLSLQNLSDEQPDNVTCKQCLELMDRWKNE